MIKDKILGEEMKKKLCEIGEIIAGGTPSTKIKEYWNGDISWITPKDLSNYEKRFIAKGERSITKEGLKNSSAMMMPKNSILFTSRAPIGYIAIAEKELCTNQGFKSFVCNEQKCYYKYMYYWFLKNVENIKAKANGSTFQEVSGSVMKNIEIELPDMKTQVSVGNVLDRIDNKIELNKQINNNLSDLVLTLFKKFINTNKDSSELVQLKDCVEKIGTGADAIQRAPIVDYDTGIRCIRVGDMTNNRKYHEWGFAKITEKDFNKYKLELGDIVITRTAVNGISKIIDDDGKIVCNNGLIRLKVNDSYNPNYIYLCTKTKDFYNYIHRIDSETSVRQNMKVDYFTSYHINKIPLEKQNEFCNKISPMLRLKKELEQETHNLEQLRNMLLPKLMNGEIKVLQLNLSNIF